jgi:hypothetical protein
LAYDRALQNRIEAAQEMNRKSRKKKEIDPKARKSCLDDYVEADGPGVPYNDCYGADWTSKLPVSFTKV